MDGTLTTPPTALLRSRRRPLEPRTLNLYGQAAFEYKDLETRDHVQALNRDRLRILSAAARSTASTAGAGPTVPRSPSAKDWADFSTVSTATMIRALIPRRKSLPSSTKPRRRGHVRTERLGEHGQAASSRTLIPVNQCR
jgi:hypothetical protein